MRKELLKLFIESNDDRFIEVVKILDADKIHWYEVKFMDSQLNITVTITVDDPTLQYLGLQVNKEIDNETDKIVKQYDVVNVPDNGDTHPSEDYI